MKFDYIQAMNMKTIGSAHRLQRLHKLHILTIPRQWGSLIVPENQKTLMRKGYLALSRSRPLGYKTPKQAYEDMTWKMAA